MKKIISLLVLLVLVASCKSTSSATKSSTSKKSDKLTKQIIDSAQDNLGSPYKSGGTTKSGFDCSGLVYSTFKNYSISLPRKSIDMSKYGKVIDVKNSEKGDLIFFKTGGSKQINHVGLIVDLDGNYIKFIHSSTSKGVIISSTKEDYYKKSFTQVNRVLE